MTLKENIVMFQTAFFFSRDIQRPDKIFWNLADNIPEFDVMPSLQPLPNGFTSNNYPLLTFKSGNGVVLCQVAQSRLDLKILHEKEFGRFSFDALYELYIRISKAIVEYMSEQVSISIQRVGMVADYFSPSADPIKKIQETTGMPLEEGLEELAIRKNKRQALGNKVSNYITNMEAVDLVRDHISHSGVMLSVDINNVPQQDIILQKNDLIKYLDAGFEQLREESFKERIHGNTKQG
ncbi:TPA: hypothetical protein NJ373_000642 [Vibrio parahaemolyticus]|nr:hypothetical protein [Vibrio parahaemolyticus]HCH6423629.1 hypothetical protein [Vibrio parahaemolyticus]